MCGMYVHKQVGQGPRVIYVCVSFYEFVDAYMDNKNNNNNNNNNNNERQ